MFFDSSFHLFRFLLKEFKSRFLALGKALHLPQEKKSGCYLKINCRSILRHTGQRNKEFGWSAGVGGESGREELAQKSDLNQR